MFAIGFAGVKKRGVKMKNVDKDELVKKMFGIDLPGVPESEWPKGTAEILKMMGKGSRVVRKPDGSISIYNSQSIGDMEFFDD